MWQDSFFLVGNICFGVAMIPSIRGGQRPARLTSFGTALILSVFAGLYVTLAFPLAATSTAVEALLWWYFLATPDRVSSTRDCEKKHKKDTL